MERHVISADGTRISVEVVGSGPPLVFVHGTLSTGREWLPVAGMLADRFTCHVMHRRGRRGSGDASAYSIDREWQDIQSVAETAGAGAHLAGHSYGAICVLEAARRFATGSLVLHEPPLPIAGPVVGGILATLRQAVAAGRVDEALTIGLRQLLHVKDDQLRVLRTTPLWDELVSLTPGAVRELEEVDRLEPGVARFAGVTVPALLLAGTSTAPYHTAAVIALQQALPDARTVWLEGQGHEAHVNAPELVARQIAGFLAKP